MALVWAAGDVGQVALAWASGIGDRVGDQPLVVFAASAFVGVALLAALCLVNVVALKRLADRSRLDRLGAQARIILMLCAARLVIGVGLIVVTRGASEAQNEVPQLTFATLVMLAVLDGVVALGIAGWTLSGVRQSALLSARHRT